VRPASAIRCFQEVRVYLRSLRCVTLASRLSGFTSVGDGFLACVDTIIVRAPIADESDASNAEMSSASFDV